MHRQPKATGSYHDLTMTLYKTLLLVSICGIAHTFTLGSSSFRSRRNIFDVAVHSAVEPISSSVLLSSKEGTSLDEITGVTLKIAFDSQGGVADLSSEKSERFTCGESLDMVHRLRRVSDAVLVGRSTVDIDDCTLTVRRVPLLALEDESSGQKKYQQQPVRVIIDPKLDLKLEQFKIFNDGLATIIIHTVTDEIDNSDLNETTGGDKYKITTDKDYPNVTFLGLRNINDQGVQRLSTRHMCDILATEFGIHHIMVEGGPNTALQFLKDGTVDRAILVYAPVSFKDPLLSNISTTILDHAGLEFVGNYTLGVDSVKCYSRPKLQWPSAQISSWP